jgi:plastocyanin
VVSVSDGGGRPLGDAVVYVLPHGERSTAAAGTSAQIAQRGKQFEPRTTVVQTGTAVHFPNFDTVRHHVYSFSPVRKFEIKLYAGTPASPVVFDKPGTAVLGCNIHDRMSAWVHVVDTPLFARTDTAGQVTLDVPEGDHVLRAWHPLLAEATGPAEQPVRVSGAGTRIAIRLPVGAAP